MQIDAHQPTPARGQIVFSLLTPIGVPGGKVSAAFLPAFCRDLRRSGYQTHFCTSVAEIDARQGSGLPTIIVHLYGEDRFQIASPAVRRIEEAALTTFNRAETGAVLANKVRSQEVLVKAGVLMPELAPESGVAFQRQVHGSSEPSAVVKISAGTQASGEAVLTRYVETRVRHRGADYFTSVRLLCIDDAVLHAFPRARDAVEGNPNVHARDTPLDPSLIEALNDRLIIPFRGIFDEIARRAHQALGHGFYAHDLMVERDSGTVYLCESGFKFDDDVYTDLLAPIRTMLPSQALFFPTEAFARASAEVFCVKCDGIIAGKA